MKRTPVRSSNVASVGFDPNTSTLEVEFHGGGLYEYYEVPEKHYVNLTSGTRSVGNYLNKQIKGSYRYRQLGFRRHKS